MILRNTVRQYLAFVTATKAKSPLTLEKERSSLAGWVALYGDIQVKKIDRDFINEFAVAKSEEGGASNRTINLHVLMLGNALKYAVEGGHVARNVAAEWHPLRHKAPKRQLMPTGTLDLLVAAALATKADGRPAHPNGQFLADYLKLLAYSGCRREAGLAAKWEDVSFERRQITFHTKFDKAVVLDLNPALEDHLRQMYLRRKEKNRPEDADWLFPGRYVAGSPRPHIDNPSRLFAAVCADAGVSGVTLHDFRHAFASRAIMAGIDAMTVASMLGHADGGALVARVYGHLNSAHLKAAASKLNF